jgi:hypothetical protein
MLCPFEDSFGDLWTKANGGANVAGPVGFVFPQDRHIGLDEKASQYLVSVTCRKHFFLFTLYQLVYRTLIYCGKPSEYTEFISLRAFSRILVGQTNWCSDHLVANDKSLMKLEVSSVAPPLVVGYILHPIAIVSKQIGNC